MQYNEVQVEDDTTQLENILKNCSSFSTKRFNTSINRTAHPTEQLSVPDAQEILFKTSTAGIQSMEQKEGWEWGTVHYQIYVPPHQIN